MIDWPGARLGPGALDLDRLLCESIATDVRRAEGDALLSTYLETLSAAGVRDYARADLDRDLRHAALFGFGSMAWWAGRDDPRATTPRVAALIESGVSRSAAKVADLGLAAS